MGMLTEAQIRDQLTKGQGEANQRLDALLAEQRRTNELLAQLLRVLGAQQQVAEAPLEPVSFGTDAQP